ncbi:MAG: hypothetical protein ACRETD_03615, partial [Steroidobacteraceae bacterium]
VTNVYNRTVINNVNVNRVSFNGGAGGVQARPTAHELAAEHEHHIEATSAQIGHEHAAAGNRDLRASVNHGRPAVAATSRPGEFSGRGVVAARASGAHGGPAGRGEPEGHGAPAAHAYHAAGGEHPAAHPMGTASAHNDMRAGGHPGGPGGGGHPAGGHPGGPGGGGHPAGGHPGGPGGGAHPAGGHPAGGGHPGGGRPPENHGSAHKPEGHR